MAHHYQLRVNQPCSQDWNLMQPVDHGRFCAGCQKTVVDFTSMSDREILDWLSGHPGGFCGRLEAGQTNRNLSGRPKKHAGWIGWRYLFAGLLFSAKVPAQQQPATVPVSRQYAIDQTGGTASPNEKPVTCSRSMLPDTIRGQVIDAESHEPVPFASIVFDRHHGFQADVKGNFVIYTRMLNGSRLLTISAIGYATIQIDLNSSIDSIKAFARPLQMSLSSVIAGDVVVTKKRSRAVRILEDTLSALGIVDRSLTVYPNPVTRGGSIRMSLLTDSPGIYSVQLFSLAGALVEGTEVTDLQRSNEVFMNIPSTLTPGNYLVRVSRRGRNKVYTRQIIVL